MTIKYQYLVASMKVHVKVNFLFLKEMGALNC